MKRVIEKLVNDEDVFVNQLNLDNLYYFPFCTNKNIIIPPIVKETKECYCTYSKHPLTNKKLWFKNLLENIKS